MASALLTKLYEFGITPSNSRPMVSDYNAFIESLFNNMKVTQWFPTGGFKCIDTCYEWAQNFVQYYNFWHRHKGITWVALAQRHEGLDVQILENRSKVYDAG